MKLPKRGVFHSTVLLKTGGFCSVNKYVRSERYHGSAKSKVETKQAQGKVVALEIKES